MPDPRPVAKFEIKAGDPPPRHEGMRFGGMSPLGRAILELKPGHHIMVPNRKHGLGNTKKTVAIAKKRGADKRIDCWRCEDGSITIGYAKRQKSAADNEDVAPAPDVATLFVQACEIGPLTLSINGGKWNASIRVRNGASTKANSRDLPTVLREAVRLASELSKRGAA